MPQHTKREALLNQLRAQAKRDAPDLPDVPIQGLGVLGTLKRLLTPAGKEFGGAYNTLLKKIEMNLNASDLPSTLVHELQHARQARQDVGPGFYEGPYHQKPSELEAFQVENQWRAAHGLPPVAGREDFETGQPYVAADIFLGREKKKK